jgi:hypothetical protein
VHLVGGADTCTEQQDYEEDDESAGAASRSPGLDRAYVGCARGFPSPERVALYDGLFPHETFP